MKLEIQTYLDISFDLQCKIISEYCKKYQIKTTHKDCDSIFGNFARDYFNLNPHPNHGTKIELDGMKSYYISCKKTKTKYIFNIWMA